MLTISVTVTSNQPPATNGHLGTIDDTADRWVMISANRVCSGRSADGGKIVGKLVNRFSKLHGLAGRTGITTTKTTGSQSTYRQRADSR